MFWDAMENHVSLFVIDFSRFSLSLVVNKDNHPYK